MSWHRDVIGGYQILEEVGRGGMAVVYRGYQPQLDRPVAIKVLESTGAEFLARFRREARAIAALRHPNILTIYDYGEQEGVAYIVMEYVPGGTLKAWLDACPIGWSEAAALVIPVGRALEYAHSQGIVHRDVKPANVLMARPDWPLLADFGLAKLLDTRTGITQPGASMGTPDYLSPEQAAGEPVDERTDVYALGVVLYELLTGQVPCQAESSLETMLRRVHHDPEPLCNLNPAISPQVEAVVMRTVDRDPNARFASMHDMVEALIRLPGAVQPGTTPLEQTGSTVILPSSPKQRAAIGPRLVIAGFDIVLPLPPQDDVVIGRGDPRLPAPPDIDLEPYGGSSAGVSRRHARLLQRAEGWLIEDLGSTNGTFVNEAHISPHQPTFINDGDNLRLGTLAMAFYL